MLAASAGEQGRARGIDYQQSDRRRGLLTAGARVGVALSTHLMGAVKTVLELLTASPLYTSATRAV